MFNKRILAAPVIALAALAMSAPQALSGGHSNRPAAKPNAATGARPGGAIHSPPQGHKPGGALNYHPMTSKKPIGTPNRPAIGGKTKVTPKGGSKPGLDRPSSEKLPPGVVSLPTANSDRRWWGRWGSRWWERDEHCCRHEHGCCYPGPWWSQGSAAGSSPAATSSVTVETQPTTTSASDTNAADIIREMSRANEREKPGKFVDERTKREKLENK